MKFLPGPGLGGHCIPVDPAYLSWKMKALNFNARFIELATEINTSMPTYVVARLAEVLNKAKLPLNGSRVLILGAAYKRGVSDTRESPALDVMELLLEKGSDVSFYDPYVSEVNLGDHVLKRIDTLDAEALYSADLVVILTDHAEVDYEWVVAEASLVFDTRNATKDVSGPKENLHKL